MSSLSLLSLHNEILLEILSLLGRGDALAISSTHQSHSHKSPASSTSDISPSTTFSASIQASNLRIIEIHSFELFVHQAGILVDAIGAMHNLEQASLIDVGPETVAALPEILSSRYLTSLTLEFDEMYFGPGGIDLEDLVSGLASMQNLHTLTLISYLVSTNSLRLPDATQTVLPSIRHLSFCCLSQTPPGIIPLCPNIITLSLRLNAEGQRPVILSMADEDRWPTGLKRLDVLSPVFIPAARRIGHVGSLALGEVSGLEVFSDFFQLPLTVRPTALELHTTPTIAVPRRVWETLCDVAPGLRSLEVVVTSGECDEPLLAALRSAPLALVHFSLHFPPTTQRHHASSIAQVDGWRAAEVRRVEALRPLSLRLVKAVPTFRVLSCSSCLPGSTGFDTWRARARHTDLDAGVRAELARENVVERRWGPASEFVSPALRRLKELWTEIPRDERWWWVEGDGAASRPVEVWREAGEQAREHANFDPTSSLDGERFIALEGSVVHAGTARGGCAVCTSNQNVASSSSGSGAAARTEGLEEL
ncbi:uncharacterized protein BXZ73DRAFT_82682 [Epithele typhae]|uniref:uncharacterized protein n=1 Tax=Epithele typhae TaxID=378194 RepID=UPI00200814ED|nr:uncharacterized protein BXZ73DRAFT_82682 [Epithele typhae]KAH9911612.1 hypothetical protein BXZ73DRAFT_82682 [Epithele typhae]